MINGEKTIYVETTKRQKSNNEGQMDQKDKRQNSQSTKTKDKQESMEYRGQGYVQNAIEGLRADTVRRTLWNE